ncbi:putative DNA primase/helicase [Novosphingobium chloroacetimidivorans]|uniref:Putative DNA primase/helicase n=1 Tax=Novosphingobium chloroacetimidivorans TaxID=1428314 RepID=A0A7W7NV74_9SPHN|nr:hypothetical protein [Novosphingobium chloroacetimidivorans]MBB4858278.1 putative DNA primase/helicase [Novosphingobium chloroacetimidivorans]
MTEAATVTRIAERFDHRPTDERTRIIEVKPDALHLIATEAEDALVEADAPLYVRSGGGGIVRPVIDEVDAFHSSRTKVARLCSVGADNLTDYLCRVAHWVKYNARQKGLVPTDPPPAVAKMILGREGEWQLRVIAGVITTPTMRQDGSILCEAGYDEATRLLLLDPPTLPPIPDRPTKTQALESLLILDTLLDEFPFADAPSRSVALSMLITPVVRAALKAVPLQATTAPVAGSGKSYIVDISCCIGTGQPAPVIAAAQKDEETEKRLGAALLSGQAIIPIDNVNGQLGGDLLCQMIERPVVSPRILGFSKLVNIENRATVFATGNNIQMVGDMTRRVVLCTLDPGMERPELRKFEAKPVDMVLSDRGKYIAAALTVCRAYAVAGYPDQCRPLASFEDWSRVVRSALVWLGREDPVATMEAARADDPVTSLLRTLFTSWYEATGSNWMSAAELKRTAETTNPHGGYNRPDLNQALRDAAADRGGTIDAGNLGRFLGRHKGRVIQGLKLVNDNDLHAKSKLWRLERLETAA